MIIFLRLISIALLLVIGYFCYTIKQPEIVILAFSGFIAGILFVLSYVLDIAINVSIVAIIYLLLTRVFSRSIVVG